MSDSSEDYSTETSSSDEEPVFHKPVLLKKSTIIPNPDTIDNNEQKAQDKLKRSIDQANQIAYERDELRRQTELSYSASDKELIRKTLEIDDDDSIDPAKELDLWSQRQQSRKERQRAILVRKQLSLEQDEINRINNRDDIGN
ncbi:Pre-mRNA-splicing factor SPP381 [Nakaseomyces glabratus]|nr:Pre-mRNA-splicing factor SPP381 [Nakaseomyces glabratus]KTB22715.1 Pre-mRNA-splicing factor SPP381 [Nakaseomyces glabratus]